MFKFFKKRKEVEEKFELSPAWDEFSNIIKETQEIINEYLESSSEKFESMDKSYKKIEQELADIASDLEAQGADLEKYRNMTHEELIADIKKSLKKSEEVN